MRYTLKVAEYTKEVAQCNEKLSKETHYLREITEKSWYVNEAAGYLFDQYYDLVEEWPSTLPTWIDFVGWKVPPLEKEKPRVFRTYCRRILLEMLFPRIKVMEGKVKTRLEEKGFKFRGEN